MNNLAQLRKELEDALKAVEETKEKIRQIHSEMERIKEEKFKKTSTKDWTTLLTVYDEDGFESETTYKACLKALPDIGLLTFGYSPESNQRLIQVVMRRDGSNKEKTLEALEEILPYIIPTSIPEDIATEEGEKWKVIDIFEHTLSERGIYSGREKDGKWLVTKTTYGHTTILFTADNVADWLDRVIKDHWYQ